MRGEILQGIARKVDNQTKLTSKYCSSTLYEGQHNSIGVGIVPIKQINPASYHEAVKKLCRMVRKIPLSQAIYRVSVPIGTSTKNTT